MAKIKTLFKTKAFMYILLFLFCLFLASCANSYDFDLYARLIVGENFFEKGVFNYTDYLSYVPTHKWFDHEYGASLIYYLFFKFFGVFGFVLAQALALFLTGFFVIKTQALQKHSYPASMAFMALFFLFMSRQNDVLIRCHLCSFVLFAVFLYLLEKTRISLENGKDTKLVWLIPPLTVLWNNLHGGVVSGIGLVGIYMLGAVISKQNWIKYLKVLLCSLPLLAINPYGFEYFGFLLSANTKSRVMISEWWDVFAGYHIFHYYPQFLVGLFALLINILNYLDKKRVNTTKLLVLLVTLVLGGMHVKLLSLLLITVFALYYNEIIRLIRCRWLRLIEKITYIIVIICVFCIPLKHPFVSKTNINKFPVKEVEFININNIKGNILTEFGYGSYVSYKLYPDNLVYFDGRYEEVYYDKDFEDLMAFEKGQDMTNAVLNKYPTDLLLIAKTTPVYGSLANLKGWEKIYEGDVCGIFVKKSNLKNKYKTPYDNIEYYRDNEFINKGYFGKKNDK